MGIWQRMRHRAPRQLNFSRSGKTIVFVALAIGFAAINTGNNLLFLGWGMVLSAIVLSGVLSELNVRYLTMQAKIPKQLRARKACRIPFEVHNRSRWLPAFAVDLYADVDFLTLVSGAAATRVMAPFTIRLDPNHARMLHRSFVPPKRGLYRLKELGAQTAYPFGFFTKGRRFSAPRSQSVWCLPASVDVFDLANAIMSRQGEAPSQHPGIGDDFFSLRPYREGDDLRRVHFRRSAQVGRFMVIESEATAGHTLVLDLQLPSLLKSNKSSSPNSLPKSDAHVEAICEHGLAVLGSLAELLLERGFAIGIRVGKIALSPSAASGQKWHILQALACFDLSSGDCKDLLKTDAADAPIDAHNVGWVSLVAQGATPSSGCDWHVDLPRPDPSWDEAAL